MPENNFFDILPSMFLLIFSMILILRAVKLKYSLKTTLSIVIPFLIIQITLNIFLFSPLGIQQFDTWSIASVFIPQALIAMWLGKRKGISKLSAIINTYVAYYIIVLLRNVVNTYSDSLILEYSMYCVFIPLIFIYVDFFYSHLHDKIEAAIPKFLTYVMAYSAFIYAEFYTYRLLMQTTNAHVLRLDIFGVAIISVYIVSLFVFDMIVRHYFSAFEKAKDIEQYELQMNQVVNQFKIRNEKDNELKIIRHDMKHLLILTSALIQEGKTQEALDMMNQQIEVIDSTKVMQYCKDPILNAIICYYKEFCEKNDINLKIRINNVEDGLHNIKTSEIAILLSNCFENAIKAVLKANTKKEIEFKFINKNDHVVMQMKNHHNGSILLDNNNLPTSNVKDHGIGSKSIKAFTDKYKLTLDYEITDCLFVISVIFN